MGWIADAQRVAVLTGAGISTDSGIPDFRGPQGVWTKNPAAEKTVDAAELPRRSRSSAGGLADASDSGLWSAQPNTGHRALVEIERAGKLHGVVTQNIDELHQRAGIDPDLVIEVHGTVWWTRCWSCGDRRPMAETLARVRRRRGRSACLVCGGILKSDTISFGQALVPEVIDRAMAVVPNLRRAARRRIDAQRVSGGELCAPRGAAGARVAIINGAADGDGSRSPTRCCAARSPSCCRRSLQRGTRTS